MTLIWFLTHLTLAEILRPRHNSYAKKARAGGFCFGAFITFLYPRPGFLGVTITPWTKQIFRRSSSQYCGCWMQEDFKRFPGDGLTCSLKCWRCFLNSGNAALNPNPKERVSAAQMLVKHYNRVGLSTPRNQWCHTPWLVQVSPTYLRGNRARRFGQIVLSLPFPAPNSLQWNGGERPKIFLRYNKEKEACEDERSRRHGTATEVGAVRKRWNKCHLGPNKLNSRPDIQLKWRVDTAAQKT